MKPTHFDLFSGIGGFALAAKWAGFETIGFSEIEPHANKVLVKNFPTIKNYGDVRNVPRIKCDIITGGFPCQPFSVAGKRGGAADVRFLWPSMLDVIKKCQPAWVIGENVAGIVSMELPRIIADLECIGFNAQSFIIPACAVGCFHVRERVWIIAHNSKKRGARRCPEALQRQQILQRLENGGRVEDFRKRPDEISPQLCSGGNGLSAELGSYGNAIVPEVAFQILKNIRCFFPSEVATGSLETSPPSLSMSHNSAEKS